MSVEALTERLIQTALHHGAYEAAAPRHNWWDWYAAYIDARDHGGDLKQASGRQPIHGGGQAHRPAHTRQRERAFTMTALAVIVVTAVSIAMLGGVGWVVYVGIFAEHH